jgi:hypothetical protein
MREEEYRHRIDWLWTRAQECQVFSKSIHHHRSRAAMVRLAQTYANAACELEGVLERKLRHEGGIKDRPNFSAVASRSDRVDG